MTYLVFSSPSFHAIETGPAKLPSMLISTDITYTNPPTSLNTALVLGSRSNTFSKASNTSDFSLTSDGGVECIKLRRVPTKENTAPTSIENQINALFT